MPIYHILISVVGISLVSLIGIFTLSFNERFLRRILFILVAIATGALFGDAFLHLIPEAIEEIGNVEHVFLAVIAGILTFFTLEKILQWNHAHHHRCDDGVCTPETRRKPLGTLILFSDGLHNFIDGIIIAASFLVSIEVGIASTIAILIHEIPQEIGDFGVLIHSGFTKAQALFVNFLSASAAIVGALFTLIFSEITGTFLTWVIPFAAGIFIYIAGSDLVPELHKRTKIKSAILELLGIIIGIGAMYLLLFLE